MFPYILFKHVKLKRSSPWQSKSTQQVLQSLLAKSKVKLIRIIRYGFQFLVHVVVSYKYDSI